MDKLFTTREAAEYLNVSTSRIRQLVGSGKLHGQKYPEDNYRGNWYFTEEELLLYLRTRRAK